MRGFERFNTVRANAHARLRMADCLGRLPGAAEGYGHGLPGFHDSFGRRAHLDRDRLGIPGAPRGERPGGGEIFAADVARRFELDTMVSYDMGGTTAKICLIKDFQPKTARSFEVARTHRFREGSGMPISIPVVG